MRSNDLEIKANTLSAFYTLTANSNYFNYLLENHLIDILYELLNDPRILWNNKLQISTMKMINKCSSCHTKNGIYIFDKEDDLINNPIELYSVLPEDSSSEATYIGVWSQRILNWLMNSQGETEKNAIETMCNLMQYSDRSEEILQKWTYTIIETIIKNSPAAIQEELIKEIYRGGNFNLYLNEKKTIPTEKEQRHSLRALSVISEDPLFKKVLLEKGILKILKEYSKSDSKVVLRQCARVLANLTSDNSQESVYILLSSFILFIY